MGVLIATEDKEALDNIRNSAAKLGVDVMVVDEDHPRPNLRISLPMAVRVSRRRHATTIDVDMHQGRACLDKGISRR